MDNLAQILEDILSSSYTKLIYHEEKILKTLNGMTLKEFHTLDVIYHSMRSKTNTASNIAKLLGITLGTLTTNLDRLCDKGLVSRDKDVKDKRITFINLTQDGLTIKKKHENMHRKMIRAAVDKLSDSEKVSLINAINKIEV